MVLNSQNVGVNIKARFSNWHFYCKALYYHGIQVWIGLIKSLFSVQFAAVNHRIKLYACSNSYSLQIAVTP